MLEEAMLWDIKKKKKISAATQECLPRIEFTMQKEHKTFAFLS